MRRFPIIPTIIVVLAVAGMIALGFWQLQRRQEKLAFIAQVAANPTRPPVAFPRFPDDSLLFRRASAFCLQPVAVTRAGAGNAGYRLIAQCRTGAEGPGVRVQLGTTRDPNAKSTWRGGEVSGWISHAPDARPLIASLVQHQPQEMLLVSERPLGGLTANARPDAAIIPNNHLAYAVQWFFFAAIAATIYVIAVLRRLRAQETGSRTPP